MPDWRSVSHFVDKSRQDNLIDSSKKKTNCLTMIHCLMHNFIYFGYNGLLGLFGQSWCKFRISRKIGICIFYILYFSNHLEEANTMVSEVFALNGCLMQKLLTWSKLQWVFKIQNVNVSRFCSQMYPTGKSKIFPWEVTFWTLWPLMMPFVLKYTDPRSWHFTELSSI